MPVNAHKAFVSRPSGYKFALNLSEQQEQTLRNARDEICSEISSRFGSFAKSLGDQVLFEDRAPMFDRGFQTPKFRMQGSFSYHTCNQPAHVPPQEIDLDDGLFMPVSYFQKGGGRSPVIQSAAYFFIVERILAPLCEKKGWQLVTDKPSCIRVKIDDTMHTDLALYSVPDSDFQRILKDAQNRGADFAKELMMEDTAYRMLSQDEIMLAHRNEGWKKSDPRKLEDWFIDAVKEYGEQVRTVSRYLKGWKDFQWPEGRLASIALMAAVVSVFEKASAALASDRDDLALLRVAKDLPDFLSNDIANPVVEGERLDQGWSVGERSDFVARAKVLAERLAGALVQSSDRTTAYEALQEQFGGRIPDDLSLYVPDAGLETMAHDLAAPAALTLGMIDKMEADNQGLAAVNKQGGDATGNLRLTDPSEQASAEMDDVSRWVLAQCPNSRVLTRSELSRYKQHSPLCGWLVPFEQESVRFDLQIVIPKDFPWTKPRVYCPEKFQFKQFPHIEKDGAFCLFPLGTEHDPLNPKGLIWDVLKEAVRLIAASFDDVFLYEFAEEFDSYWSKTDGGRTVISLLSPGGPSRTISLWRGTDEYYLADDDDPLERWLRNRFPRTKADYEFTTATHVVLKRPILPTEYPKSGAAVLRLVRELAPNALSLLANAAENADSKFTVSFEGHTNDGPVFFAVEVMPPTKQGMPSEQRPDMLQKGFRVGKVLPHIKLQRQFGGNKVEHHDVMRADASWIHGRDAPEIAPLFDKRVLMIGAGSLGSEVAQLLAKTGVGSITLVDPELLDYSNVGRHVLGVSEVRTFKAKSLAEKLARNFPHMRSVEHFSEDWLSLFQQRPEVFGGVDLIVSTAGSWLTEGRLNQIARNEADFPPVLYGWAEPFSVAGHAVLIGPRGPCFSCGIDPFGRSLLTVCAWDASTTRKQPHCGVSFQPYGPISLAGVATLVAKTAMKSLLGEFLPGTEAVCWASQTEILEQGGRFNADFLKKIPFAPEFGGSYAFQWARRDVCAYCGDV